MPRHLSVRQPRAEKHDVELPRIDNAIHFDNLKLLDDFSKVTVLEINTSLESYIPAYRLITNFHYVIMSSPFDIVAILTPKAGKADRVRAKLRYIHIC